MKQLTAALIGLAMIALFSPAAMAKRHKTVIDPALGADCGTGASILGTATAIRIQTGPEFSNTCTISFGSATANRICSAVNETNSGGTTFAIPLGCKQIDSTTIEVDSQFASAGSDVLTVMVSTYP